MGLPFVFSANLGLVRCDETHEVDVKKKGGGGTFSNREGSTDGPKALSTVYSGRTQVFEQPEYETASEAKEPSHPSSSGSTAGDLLTSQPRRCTGFFWACFVQYDVLVRFSEDVLGVDPKQESSTEVRIWTRIQRFQGALQGGGGSEVGTMVPFF
jgi:hypothetical protein